MADFRLFITGHRPEPTINPSGAVLMGIGTESYPATSEAIADRKWLSFYLKDPSTSGTTRGMYLYLDLSSNAGGEALRAVLMNQSNTPADTVNGAHISLKFGSSAGNVTGLATAGRFTMHVPKDRNLGGTLAPIMSELYGDGSNSTAVVSNFSFLRLIVDGHADVKAAVDTSGYLFSLQGVSEGEGKLFHTQACGATAASLRIKVGAVTYYIPLATASS